MPPGLTRNTVLKTLILENNQISGTIPVGISDTMPALESLLVANNLISGTLPPGLWRLSNLKALLAHGMRLSGTIPTRASYYGTNWTLQELSLARNYVRGRTDVFEQAVNLQTLLLSGVSARRWPVCCSPAGRRTTCLATPQGWMGPQNWLTILSKIRGRRR